MSFPEYRVVYGVHLIDDLHNYFPRVLYSPTSFTTVTDLLIYIQDRTINRFNLYSYGRSLVEPTLPTGGPVPIVREEPPDVGFTVEINQAAPPMNPIVSPMRYSTGLESAILPLLRQLATPTQPRAVRTGRGFADFQDVVVAPSAAMIAAGSSLRTLDADSTENCAICQDAMRSGEEIRHLTVCNHDFHRSCIDNWFRRSVLCPTCRHDIREAQRVSPRLGPTPAPTPTEATAPTEQTNQSAAASANGRRRRTVGAEETADLLDLLFNMNTGLYNNRFSYF